MDPRSGHRGAAEVYGDLVDRLVAAAGADRRIKAVWLEGKSREELRRPFATVELHLAADEPDFEAVRAGLEALLAGGHPLADVRWAEVPRFARELRGLLEGHPVTVVLEKTSLLAKRPRTAVSSLVDPSGHLYHVMDFSGSRKE